VLELRIATPQTILNFAGFLQRNDFYEESFTKFERAVRLFDWPHCYEIWLVYLSSVIKQLAGSKVERVRHLFE